MTHSPLRITYVAPFGLGQKTTVWARTLPLAHQLVERGHQATILIPPWDTPADAGKRWVADGVQLIHTTLSGGLPGTMARLLSLIRQQQPHIVHIIKPRAHAGLAQWWLWQKRELGISDGEPGQHRSRGSQYRIPNPQSPIPKICLDIDDWEQAWAAINRYSWPVARFLAWQEEWGIRHADAITAASQWLVQRAQAYRPQTPVLYLPNGIEEPGVNSRRTAALAVESSVVRNQSSAYPISDPNSDTGNSYAPPASRNSHFTFHISEFTILFFTRFVEVEPQWLVNFWQALHQRYPTAQLLVAGDALQPGRAATFQQQMQAQAPGAAKQVNWLGYVERHQLEQLYHTVTCAIFPAQEIPLLQAKCSVKLATTLLHGVPVVASAVGEQAAYGAEGAALLVEPAATPTQFADAVIGVLQQPTQQRALIEQARQRLFERYRWAQLGGQLEAFYQALLRRC